MLKLDETMRNEMTKIVSAALQDNQTVMRSPHVLNLVSLTDNLVNLSVIPTEPSTDKTKVDDVNK